MKSSSKTAPAAHFFDENVFYPRLDKRDEDLEKARKEALKSIQDAEDQAVISKEQFRKEGVQQGYDEVRQATQPLADSLQSIIQELSTFKKNISQELEPIVLDLALRIAKKVIKTEIGTNKNIIIENVRTALKSIIDREQVTICVHPEDHATLEHFRPELVREFHGMEDVTFTAKDTIVRGGCHIQTQRGELDATMETQIEQIANAYYSKVTGAL